MSKIHIVIPDSHSHPDFSNERYTWLGKLIADVKPSTVIDIGDWADMPSLSAYDRGKRSFEGRRYSRDIAAAVEAQDRMFHEIRKQKKKLPRFIRTLGNHEHRIERALDADPILQGTIGLSDLQSREYGFEEYPFLDIVTVDGIDYAHYFITGVSGRPVGGEHPGHMLLMKRFKSSTQGHSHLLDHTIRTVDNRKLHGLSCGVFQDYDADWAGPINSLWSRGVCIKRDVENGDYDLEWISLKRLKEEYSNA